MIKRYESCFGLSFPSFGRYKIEIWFACPNYEIKPHTHNNQDIKLIFLFGHNIIFHRKKAGQLLGETFWARLKHIGKIFTINAGDQHWFEVSSWPLLFLNVEKWKDGVKITSASEDLQLSKIK